MQHAARSRLSVAGQSAPAEPRAEDLPHF